MKVLVLGNIGSGKTTLVKKLRDRFYFDMILIDDFRRMYGDGSMEKELFARRVFLSEVKKKRNQFIECLGVGRVSDNLFKLLYQTDEIIVCVILVCAKNTCQSRLSTRNWDIPFPHPVSKVNSLIEKTGEIIIANEIETFWCKRKNTILIKRNNESINDLEEIITETTDLIRKHLRNERS